MELHPSLNTKGSTNNILNTTNQLTNTIFNANFPDDKDQPNYSQHSFIQNNLNGNNYNNEFIEKLFNENYNYKHEISNLKNKLVQFKLENEKLKSKLKKYIQQSDFLEKKLESYKISNGSNLYLFSNNNNNPMNVSSSSYRPQGDFERLYYEKCEEFENFEQNFDKISEKFSNVLEKIQQYQCNLIEDNKRLKEFLIFILQCCSHKQYEHVSYVISYAKEHQTFIGKFLSDNQSSESFKLMEKNYFEKTSGSALQLDSINNSNNNNKNSNKTTTYIQEYLNTEEEFNRSSNTQTKCSGNNLPFIKNSIDNVKNTNSLGINYDDLKFSKTISSKIGVSNLQSNNTDKINNETHKTLSNVSNKSFANNNNISINNEVNKSLVSINSRNKSPGPNQGKAFSYLNQNMQKERNKEFSYTEIVNLTNFNFLV